MTFDIEKVLSELTTNEKISLIAAEDFWHTTPIKRLDIPSVRVSDGPNGIRGTKFFNSVPSAAFPNGTALASTFDKELLKEVGARMADEAIQKNAGVILGPTINIQRGPLGGRGFESFSEVPYLSGIAASCIVNGIQSRGVAATLKHFVCNDLEDQRMSSNSIVTCRALREIYLEPFKLAVKYSDPQCIMTSYNKVNGVHCSNSKNLLIDILRDEWKWGGMVMSDWFGTYSVDSIKNGLDIEFPGPSKWRSLDLLKSNLDSKAGITISNIDDCVRHVLKLVHYVSENSKKTQIKDHGPETTLNNTEHMSKHLRKVASESIVLLKNVDDILPLKKESSVVVIGPNAKAKSYSGGGSASLQPYYVITPYEGICEKIGRNVEYTAGCDSRKTLSGLIEAMVVDPCQPAEGDNIGIIAQYFMDPANQRSADVEPFDTHRVTQSYVTLFDYTHPNIDPIMPFFYIHFEGFFTPEEDGEYIFGVQVFGTALFYIDDKLEIDNKTHQTKGSFCFGAGTREETCEKYLVKGHQYRIRIEYGSGPTSSVAADFGYGGIQVGFAKKLNADEEIARAVQLAKTNDNVILCIGLNGEWESEGYDRENMSLPKNNDRLISAVLTANPNTIVVNQSGMPVELPWVDQCKALLQCWYGGNELGNAIADVLYGDVVPSGKLSISWPYMCHDNPAFLNFKTESGRVLYGEDIYVGYRFYEKVRRQVAFPFGHGLSYTTFRFDDLIVSIDETLDLLETSLNVTNTGDTIAGKEVIQVYVSHNESTIGRPIKELKGFQKVFLKPNETKKVTMKLSLKDSISYFDEEKQLWCATEGIYQILVGSSSKDIKLTERFDVNKTSYWKGL
ncbi:hypothetical protein SMKI_12G0080 [Saccharomyces mikatae IFO 1815]|uniref:beta-glucosidase n=1 Tax=Saccharomyces mikatae IFO 1815 TaxID=226126 RepID=A0AA35IQ69_SACMI|nr:uncharacterized protein SMKI_12G0080 [Saccharomyces mikatae IFO 1815]CAI4034872.1 hypothetical protein SMKI_12G0080 [Saccharomyces mikatae IFO 1815]